MNTQPDAIRDSVVPGAAAAAPALATRPFYWSVRRELWENRSVFIGPATVAGFALFAFTVSLHDLPARRRAALLLSEGPRRAAIAGGYTSAAAMLMFIGFLVGVFYCLDALYGERRDRSVLFWKSLPVSDRTTVLAKAAIPLMVLPVVTYVVTIVTQAAMLLLSSFRLVAGGVDPSTTWANYDVWAQPLILLYAVIVAALWHAPVYAWLLLVSAWSRRTPLVWAVLPLITIAIFERIVAGTSYFGKLMQYRLVGGFGEAYDLARMGVVDRLSQLTPIRFFSSPGLWLGLVVAAAFLAMAVRLRRDRGPI